MNTYVLSVTTGREQYMKQWLESYKPLKTVYERIWAPTKPYHVKIHGDYIADQRIMFPGYIFIDAEDFASVYEKLCDLHIDSYFSLLGKKGLVQTINGEDVVNDVLRIVTAEEIARIALISSETPAEVEMIGRYIRFPESSPLAGMNGYISKYDRHKRNACLRMEFFGEERDIWMAVDILPAG